MNPAVRRTADWISLLLNPSVLTGVFFVMVAARFGDPPHRGAVGLTGVLFATVLPVGSLFALHARGRLSDVEMRVRAERGLVYAVCLTSYLAGTGALVAIHAPWQAWGMMALHLPSTAVLALMTRVSKVSVHAMVITGLWAAGVVLFGPSALPAGLLVPLAAWARWAAGAHTPAELAVGAITGLILSGGGAMVLARLLGP